MTLGCKVWRRENVSSCRVRLSPRCVAVVIASSKWICLSSLMWRRSRCTLPLTIIKQIVEVVGDAAGQLADGLELLRLVQRAFRHFAALGFVVQALGAAQREPQHGEQQQRRRQAEDQMGAHGHEPFVVDRRDAGAGQRIDRIAGKLAKADAPGHAVDLGVDGEHAVVTPWSMAMRSALVGLKRCARLLRNG